MTDDSPEPGRAGATTVWQREEIESPCIQVCMLHPESKLCLGCYRTGEEIARWSRYAPAERAAIMAELPARAPLVATRRKGGRRGRQSEA